MASTPTWVDDGSETEIPLLGGDVTEGIVRVGQTVRRPPGESAPLVRALLTHLEAVGFEGAPRFLGIDAAGRDVLTFIDFDLARPATRVDEISNMMVCWAPLGDPADRDPLMRDVDPLRRCRLLADGYGMSDADRVKLVEVATMRTRRAWHLMKLRAERDGGGWLRMWEEGVGDLIQRRLAWLDRNGAALEAALTA
ncbi:MAG TPA: hypothetical protein VGM10_17840 [Actinocrinis sp.]|jgi:hypothetical protein